MGTRSDIYLRKKGKLEWLGSTAWDGYGIANATTLDAYSVNDQKSRTTDYLEYLIHASTNEADFVKVVTEYIEKREDGTQPKDGWPWPWKNSKLTDECYVFDIESGRTLRMMDHDGNYDDHTTDCKWGACGSYEWDDDKDEYTGYTPLFFKVPDMSELTNVATGNKSGLMVITSKR